MYCSKHIAKVRDEFHGRFEIYSINLISFRNSFFALQKHAIMLNIFVVIPVFVPVSVPVNSYQAHQWLG